jgi:molybdopterin converting factor small subunit
MAAATVRVSLPAHLRRLTGYSTSVVSVELKQAAPEAVTLGAVLDALEDAHPALRGTIRDYSQPGSAQPGALRPFIRFFACERDITPGGQSAAIPDEVLSGGEVLRIIGAIAGGEAKGEAQW